MASMIRDKKDLGFMTDVRKAFGEGYLTPTKFLGFGIGPKEVDTSKLTNEIARQTIAHTAISPSQTSNFYKRAFTVCAASLAVAAVAYFSFGSISSLLSFNFKMTPVINERNLLN